MANTIIQLKHSGASGNVPQQLQPGELAINVYDGKLFYGNLTNHIIEFSPSSNPSGLDGEIQFNDLGEFGASDKLSFNKTTGQLSVGGSVSINTNVVMESTSIVTSSLSQVTFDSWSSSSYRSAKYLVQMSSGSEYHMIELLLIHDNTTVHMSQYGEVKTGNSLGTFDASITTGTLSLLFTPTNSSTTIKGSIVLIPS
jgi:hypothetical protein